MNVPSWLNAVIDVAQSALSKEETPAESASRERAEYAGEAAARTPFGIPIGYLVAGGAAALAAVGGIIYLLARK